MSCVIITIIQRMEESGPRWCAPTSRCCRQCVTTSWITCLLSDIQFELDSASVIWKRRSCNTCSSILTQINCCNCSCCNCSCKKDFFITAFKRKFQFFTAFFSYLGPLVQSVMITFYSLLNEISDSNIARNRSDRTINTSCQRSV